MLELALKAQLPLIRVETDDTVNVGNVLTHLAGKPVKVISPLSIKTEGKLSLSEGTPYAVISPSGLVYEELYMRLAQMKTTLVIVNPVEVHPTMFNGGHVSLPKEMLREKLEKHTTKENLEKLVAAFSGLSLKEVMEIAKMSMVKSGQLTPRAVREVRREYFGTVRGLKQVDTKYLLYMPNEVLDDWVNLEGQLFLAASDPLLVPRGLMLEGKPGTGKTMGAKFIANTLDIPLYWLDLGTMMSKYVGESEKNLSACLRQAENSEPCVLLIDEVEKLFQQTDDGGVSTRLLSSLLWWLQEHKSRVLTIMTTNNAAKIPQELYRPGRIDSRFECPELNMEGSLKLAFALQKKLAGIYPLTDGDVATLLGQAYGPVSHAQVTGMVLKLVKQKYFSTLTP